MQTRISMYPSPQYTYVRTCKRVTRVSASLHDTRDYTCTRSHTYTTGASHPLSTLKVTLPLACSRHFMTKKPGKTVTFIIELLRAHRGWTDREIRPSKRRARVKIKRSNVRTCNGSFLSAKRKWPRSMQVAPSLALTNCHKRATTFRLFPRDADETCTRRRKIKGF